ncbi:hypothetical protein [Streptomyces sp. A1136]|uniref:hypothetical protein n=1 Tax=Streptomyces sp. A1136 TaxID=2563102 RepID=UPI00109E7B3D|nr:hypothetical protein [Streptomyces sp. A1136]THA53230.1 hypothetical protein E6R62_19265 [Streptomyces sp. A1136]
MGEEDGEVLHGQDGAGARRPLRPAPPPSGPRPTPGRPDHDALTVVPALAHADGPLTADGLAAALSWTRHRLDAALDQSRAHPDTGGALVLRHLPPEAYTATPRLDVLAPHQVDANSPAHASRLTAGSIDWFLRRHLRLACV